MLGMAAPPEPVNTRQRKRYVLFRVAMVGVNQRNSKEGASRHFYWLLSRHERRNLARAYAAGKWRRMQEAECPLL